MAQATWAVRDLNKLFKLQFFVIKQVKMYFAFKLFFSYHVTNQNLKKAQYFLPQTRQK